MEKADNHKLGGWLSGLRHEAQDQPDPCPGKFLPESIISLEAARYSGEPMQLESQLLD